MGVRTLVGEYDGDARAAVMVDSASGTAFGPLFEGPDAEEQVDAFLEWMRRLPFVTLAAEIGLDPADVPHPALPAQDPRYWPESGLAKLGAFWRREVRIPA